MQLKLELLAPAKNKDIGIAAIDCGADAVYIAGPLFGAREAAGNPVSEIKELAIYAHRYSAKVYVTINTILYDNEIGAASELMQELRLAGVDAFIIQDLGLLKDPYVTNYQFFASTQTHIRTPEQAAFLESIGFSRLILERQLSIEQIVAIRKAVSCDLEFFVHGALCTSYSGQCYLSRRLSGRSANRGECIQACRAKYDLVDEKGNVLLKNKSILSLKDLKLDEHIPQLIEAGITSFKIEGRLKDISYVKNIVRHYRNVIDAYILEHRQYCRASFGTVTGGFTPDPNITFNRGYTTAFIDGTRGDWNSTDASRSIGEYLGVIGSVNGDSVTIDTSKTLSNGDGLAFISPDGEIVGMRADLCKGNCVWLKEASSLRRGWKVYRNLNVKFKKELEKNAPKRLLNVAMAYLSKDGVTTISAESENGAKALYNFTETYQEANNPERAVDTLKRQLSKNTGPFTFHLNSIECDKTYSYPMSTLNGIRRMIADKLLDNLDAAALASVLDYRTVVSCAARKYHQDHLTYLGNVANSYAEALYREHGVMSCSPSYEISAPGNIALMRTKYCIKYELGLCPSQKGKSSDVGQLYLSNVKYKLKLEFDCKNCEMVVIL